MKNKDLQKEAIAIICDRYILTAQGCIESASMSFGNGKKDEAEYWLRMADIHCKLALVRILNDN